MNKISKQIHILLLLATHIAAFTVFPEDRKLPTNNSKVRKARNLAPRLSQRKNSNQNPTPAFKWVTLDPFAPTTKEPLKLPSQTKKDKVEYKVIEQRGMVMERHGTLVSYNSIDLLSVIIKIPPLSTANITTNCSQYLDPINKEYNKTMEKYHKMLIHLLQPSIKVSRYKLCKLVGNPKCTRAKKVILRPAKYRNTRFAELGISIAALSIASISLGLAIDNRIQLEKIEDYVDSIAHDVQTIATSLQETNERQKELFNMQSSILGYIATIREDIDKIHEMVECTRIEMHYQQWFNEIIVKLKEILIYPLQGTLSGRLRPSILTPEQIAYSISDSAHEMKDLLTHLPLIFYSSATVTLIDFDLQKLLFKFIITYPLLHNTNSIMPIFQVNQVGFHSQIQEHSSNQTSEQCLIFDMPTYATKMDEKWFTLTLPQDKCPIIGSFSVCPETTFQLNDMESCIDLPLSKNAIPVQLDISCKINKCAEPSSYINLQGGVLIRSIDQKIEVLQDQNTDGLTISDLTSQTTILNTTNTNTIWIPWKPRLTAVQVQNKVIHNPNTGTFQAKLEVLEAKNFSHIIELAQILDSSFESQIIINEIEQHQETITTLTGEIDASNKLLDTIGMLIKFYKDPMRYIKIPLIVVGSILFVLLIIFVGIKLKPYYTRTKSLHLFGKPRSTPPNIPPIIEEDHVTQPTYLALTQHEHSRNTMVTPSAPPPTEPKTEKYSHRTDHLPKNKKRKTTQEPANPYSTISRDLHQHANYFDQTYMPLTTIIATDDDNQ